MLGIQDPWVAAAFILSVASSILCVVYGALNWNKTDEEPGDVDRHWVEEEDRIEEEL